MIGLYGGTFNPVHYGHLRTALEIKERFNLRQLRLIPCRLPAHRHQPDVSGEMRLRMLELAIADTPELMTDRCELDRDGPSYMIDTLRSISEIFSGEPLLLIIGADAFRGLQDWHDWQNLFCYAHVLVMTRPGFTLEKLPDFFQGRLLTDPAHIENESAGRLLFQAVTLLDISATRIRTDIAAGSNPKFLLPDTVLAFIRKHRLYQAAP